MKLKRQHWLLGAGLVSSLIAGVVIVSLAVTSVSSGTAPTRIQAITSHALDDQYRPLEPTGVFSPDDTLYLSVRVENAPPHSVIGARWRYGDAVITTEDQAIAAGPGVYVIGFELRRLDQPWPVGGYDVQILLNGDVVGVAEFTVAAEAD